MRLRRCAITRDITRTSSHNSATATCCGSMAMTAHTHRHWCSTGNATILTEQHMGRAHTMARQRWLQLWLLSDCWWQLDKEQHAAHRCCPDFVNAPAKTTHLFYVTHRLSLCAIKWRTKVTKSRVQEDTKLQGISDDWRTESLGWCPNWQFHHKTDLPVLLLYRTEPQRHGVFALEGHSKDRFGGSHSRTIHAKDQTPCHRTLGNSGKEMVAREERSHAGWQGVCRCSNPLVVPTEPWNTW